MPYNLASRNVLLQPCDLADLRGWYAEQTLQVENKSIRKILLGVEQNLKEFVRWPRTALLLWKGCDRVPPPGKKQRYHRYTESIRRLAKSASVNLDRRANGPAIAAFDFAGGERPDRFGSSNKWSIHHVYSGKFPYPGRTATLHATKKGLHFTQSAGLIAVHPIADAMADEFPFFAWLLRAESYNRFGYDPDGVFSKAQDQLGFGPRKKYKVMENTPPN